MRIFPYNKMTRGFVLPRARLCALLHAVFLSSPAIGPRWSPWANLTNSLRAISRFRPTLRVLNVPRAIR